jgi:hypothetical protein
MIMMKTLKNIFVFIIAIFIWVILYNVLTYGFMPEFSTHLASYSKDNNWSAHKTADISGLTYGILTVIMYLVIFYVFKKLFFNKNTKKINSKFNDTESGAEMSLEDETLDISYEKEFYNAAFDEITTGNIDGGIWSMAFAQSMGNEEEAQAIYITLRAKELKELSDLEEKMKEEILENNNVRRAKSRHNWIIFFTLLLFIIFVAFILS